MRAGGLPKVPIWELPTIRGPFVLEQALYFLGSILSPPCICGNCDLCRVAMRYVGVSQNQGYDLEVLIIRIIVFWGLYWGSLILGNYRMCFSWTL